MKYLGIPLEKPKVGIFGFTGCEGCQLQIANKEETLGDLLSAIEVMNFRLISSDKHDGYDIAFVEGSITTEDEVTRLQENPGASQNSGRHGGLRLPGWGAQPAVTLSTRGDVRGGVW